MIFAVGIIPPQKKVQLKLLRGGEYREIEGILAERQTEETLNAESLRTWPGIAAIPLDRSLIDALREMNLAVPIQNASRSDLIGLQENDIITEINGQEVRSLKDFYGILNQAGPEGRLSYTLLRGGREIQTDQILPQKQEP